MGRYLVQATTAGGPPRVNFRDLETWCAEHIAALGGRLHSLDVTVGETDLVLLLELPNEASLIAFAELVSACRRFAVTRAFPMVSAEQAARVFDNAAPAPDSEPGPTERGPDADELGLRPSTVLVGSAAPMPGSYELLAGRFARYSELGPFVEAVHALPGALSVSVKLFKRGMVLLHVNYESPIPFATRLRDMHQFKPEVRRMCDNEYEMLVFTDSRRYAPSLIAEPVKAPQNGTANGQPGQHVELVRTESLLRPTAIRPNERPL